MFDYKQRPFTSKLTDEEYDRAVGHTFAPSEVLPVFSVPKKDLCTCTVGCSVNGDCPAHGDTPALL